MMSSTVGGAISSSSERRIAARCTGDVPQQPPTMRAPALTANCAYLPISSGVPVYTASVPAKYGTPQLPFEIRKVCTSRSLMASSETRVSLAPTPQLAPIATGGSPRPSNTCDSSPGRQAHHRSPGSVERACCGVWQSGLYRGRGRGADLFGCRHRLDPGDVCAAVSETGGKLRERLDGSALGEGSERFEQLARRTHGSGDDDWSRRGVGHLAGQFGSSPGQLVDASLGAVELEPMTIAAERVGEDDVGPGVDELLVKGEHLLGMVGVPELGRVARTEPTLEVVRTGGSVGEQRAPGGQQLDE